MRIPGHDGARHLPRDHASPRARRTSRSSSSPARTTARSPTATGTRILPLPVDKEKKPIGLTGYFAPRGYAVAMMDLRGTGRSEGCLDHLGPQRPQGPQDRHRVARDAAVVQRPRRHDRPLLRRLDDAGRDQAQPEGPRHDRAQRRPRRACTTTSSSTGVAWNLQYVGPVRGYPSLATAADLPPGLPTEGLPVGGPSGDNFGSRERVPQDARCEYQNTAANNGPGNVTGQETAVAQGARRDQGGHGLAGPRLPHPRRQRQRRADPGRRSGSSTATCARATSSGSASGTTARAAAPTSAGCSGRTRSTPGSTASSCCARSTPGPPVEVFLNDEATVAGADPEAQGDLQRRDLPGGAARPSCSARNDGELLEGREGEPSAMTYVADPAGFQGQRDRQRDDGLQAAGPRPAARRHARSSSCTRRSSVRAPT